MLIFVFIGQAVHGADNKRNYRPIATAYYPLQARYYGNITLKSDRRPGGAIEKMGDQYLGLTGTGAFYLIVFSEEKGTVGSRKLKLSVPMNFDSFDKTADPRANRDYFRAIDFVLRQTVGGWQLFVSHHYWNEKESCVVMRVSTITIGPDSINPKWETIYETSPCLKMDSNVRGKIYSGHESGGRLAWLGPDQLLLTTGDLEFDGWNHPVAAAQDNNYMYGKTILINVKTRKAEIFTNGHRNPQGLFIDHQGNIWLTEHGPRGGDELNLLKKGKNYGWPYETYGTEYGSYTWPPAETEHKGNFEKPVFAWLPSIGVSNLIRLNDEHYPKWKGNLLITSLMSLSLYRVELVDNRVVYVEEIPIGRRIRDIIEGPGGSIWLWGERGDLISLSVAESQDRGEALFHRYCVECHSTAFTSGGRAPTLIQLIDRPIASRKDFEYSEGFEKLKGKWTEENLDKFLTEPTVFAPGTTMSDVRLKNPEDRAAIIKYLRDISLH